MGKIWMEGFTVSNNHKTPDADKSLVPAAPEIKAICSHRKIERIRELMELKRKTKEVWDYDI